MSSSNSAAAGGKSPKPKWLYLVAMFSGPDDDIGHAFVIFEDSVGRRKGFGFYPDHVLNAMEEGEFLVSGYLNTESQPFNGVVKDEANTGYLGVFNKDVPRD